MIDLAKLKEIVKLMVDSELSEIDLKQGEDTIKIRRGAPAGTTVNHQPVIYQGQGQVQGGTPHIAHAAHPVHAAPHAAAPAPAMEAKPHAGLLAIESPMVGTFYSAANPDSPPFAKPGSQISADSVVCLIEAMKVFNEIKAEKSGVVEQVLVKNGEAVEFGQKLFLVRPA